MHKYSYHKIVIPNQGYFNVLASVRGSRQMPTLLYNIV